MLGVVEVTATSDDKPQIVEALKAELATKLDPGRAYAVRSSANIEDDFQHSFAGQFRSVLNVRGVDAVLQAMWSIWAMSSPIVVTFQPSKAE